MSEKRDRPHATSYLYRYAGEEDTLARMPAMVLVSSFVYRFRTSRRRPVLSGESCFFSTEAVLHGDSVLM